MRICTACTALCSTTWLALPWHSNLFCLAKEHHKEQQSTMVGKGRRGGGSWEPCTVGTDCTKCGDSPPAVSVLGPGTSPECSVQTHLPLLLIYTVLLLFLPGMLQLLFTGVHCQEQRNSRARLIHLQAGMKQHISLPFHLLFCPLRICIKSLCNVSRVQLHCNICY